MTVNETVKVPYKVFLNVIKTEKNKGAYLFLKQNILRKVFHNFFLPFNGRPNHFVPENLNLLFSVVFKAEIIKIIENNFLRLNKMTFFCKQNKLV